MRMRSCMQGRGWGKWTPRDQNNATPYVWLVPEGWYTVPNQETSKVGKQKNWRKIHLELQRWRPCLISVENLLKSTEKSTFSTEFRQGPHLWSSRCICRRYKHPGTLLVSSLGRVYQHSGTNQTFVGALFWSLGVHLPHPLPCMHEMLYSHSHVQRTLL